MTLVNYKNSVKLKKNKHFLADIQFVQYNTTTHLLFQYLDCEILLYLRKSQCDLYSDLSDKIN